MPSNCSAEAERIDTLVLGPNHIHNLVVQLLEATSHLAACEEDPRVDLAAASRACGQRLAALKEVLSSQSFHQPESQATGEYVTGQAAQLAQLKSMILFLSRQTQHCIGVLGRQLERTGRELASLRDNQKALRAYHGQT